MRYFVIISSLSLFICFVENASADVNSLNFDSHARSTAVMPSVAGVGQAVKSPVSLLPLATSPVLWQGAATYQKQLWDVYFTQLYFAMPLDKQQVIAGGLSYLGVNNFTLVDETGVSGARAGIYDFIATAGYARSLPLKINAGANLKFFHSELAGYSADTIAIDIALNRKWNIYQQIINNTFYLRNIGVPVKYDTHGEPLPVEVGIAADYHIDRYLPEEFGLLTGIDLRYSDGFMVIPALEALYRQPAYMVRLRGAYVFSDHNDGISMGMGFVYPQKEYDVDIDIETRPATISGVQYLMSATLTRKITSEKEIPDIIQDPVPVAELSDRAKGKRINLWLKKLQDQHEKEKTENRDSETEPKNTMPAGINELIDRVEYDERLVLEPRKGYFVYLKQYYRVIYLSATPQEGNHVLITFEGSQMRGLILWSEEEGVFFLLPAGELLVPYRLIEKIEDRFLETEIIINDFTERKTEDLIPDE